jgi:hypothetical protein
MPFTLLRGQQPLLDQRLAVRLGELFAQAVHVVHVDRRFVDHRGGGGLGGVEALHRLDHPLQDAVVPALVEAVLLHEVGRQATAEDYDARPVDLDR